MKTTTLIISVVVVFGIGYGNEDDHRRNEVNIDGDESVSLLNNLSTKQRRHVKKELLHLLGLDHTPRPAASRLREEAEDASAPKYMLGLYQSLKQRDDYNADDIDPHDKRSSSGHLNGDGSITSRLVEEQLKLADTVTSFVNQAQNYDLGSARNWMMECRFDLSQVNPADVITGAVLRIYKSSQPHIRVEKFKIEIHRIPVNASMIRGAKTTLEQRVIVRSNKNGWIDINVSHLASEWMQFPTKNKGLKIIVYNSKGDMVNPRSVGIVGSDGASDKQVFLVAFFKSIQDPRPITLPKPRRKRATEERKRTSKSENQDPNLQNEDHQTYRTYKQDRKCQIRTLKVSFKDLKWQDWIIAPEGYGAYYCDGDCVSALYAHNATNHAIVQKMAHLMNPTAVPKPCCAPTRLSGLSVLYFDDNSNVILKKYRNMIVRGCGCH